MVNKFFEKQTASSRIKASIIAEYFPSYCKIITKANKPKAIRYIDLFAGPGIYEDGNDSTPIIIAKRCFRDQTLRENVEFVFNDKEFSSELRCNFLKEFPEGTFPHKPHFINKVVGKDDTIRQFLLKSTHKDNKNEYPSLLFIDPFGYKGIETKILAQFLKNWGNEIFLFVNVKRIHPALENEKFEELMTDLFPTLLNNIKTKRMYTMSVNERLNLIIDNLGNEYKQILNSKIYYTAFQFKEEDSEATSHYILHITKHSRGFDLVKQIYNDFANVGTIFDGKHTYTFDAKKLECSELFDMDQINIEKLEQDIYECYKSKTVTALELFDSHQKRNLYSRSHYVNALRILEREGRLSAKYMDNVIHKASVLISKDCILSFN